MREGGRGRLRSFFDVLRLLFRERFVAFADFAVNDAQRHIAPFGQFVGGHFLLAPGGVELVKIIGQMLRRTAEFDAPRFGGGDPFRLTAADFFPLALRHKGKDLAKRGRRSDCR